MTVSEPNTEQATTMVGAGVMGMLVAFSAGAIWFGAYFASGFALFSTPELSFTERLTAYLVAPVLLAAACLLPARVMGASWRLALLASVGISVAVSVLVDLSGFDPKAICFALIAAPGVVALIVAVATGVDPAVIPTLVISTGLLFVAGVAMLSAGVLVLAVFVSLSGWPLLPAIAGLFQLPTEPRAAPRR